MCRFPLFVRERSVIRSSEISSPRCQLRHPLSETHTLASSIRHTHHKLHRPQNPESANRPPSSTSPSCPAPWGGLMSRASFSAIPPFLLHELSVLPFRLQLRRPVAHLRLVYVPNHVLSLMVREVQQLNQPIHLRYQQLLHSISTTSTLREKSTIYPSEIHFDPLLQHFIQLIESIGSASCAVDLRLADQPRSETSDDFAPKQFIRIHKTAKFAQWHLVTWRAGPGAGDRHCLCPSR